MGFCNVAVIKLCPYDLLRGIPLGAAPVNTRAAVDGNNVVDDGRG